MRYLLDTDHVSILQHGRGAEYETLSSRLVAAASEGVALSVVSLHEQLLGAHTYVSRARTTGELIRGYALMHKVLSAFSIAEVLPFDAAAGAAFEQLKGLNLRVATTDLRIASVAVSKGMTVLTRNSRDFDRVPGLAVEDWTVPPEAGESFSTVPR